MAHRYPAVPNKTAKTINDQRGFTSPIKLPIIEIPLRRLAVFFTLPVSMVVPPFLFHTVPVPVVPYRVCNKHSYCA